jgi:hypothetical protein
MIENLRAAFVRIKEFLTRNSFIGIFHHRPLQSVAWNCTDWNNLAMNSVAWNISTWKVEKEDR